MNIKRNLLFAIFVIMLAGLIQVVAILVNPLNWPSVCTLLTALPIWATVLIILAFIALVWWVIRSTFAAIRKINKREEKDRKKELKRAVVEALVEAGVAKRKVKKGKRIKRKP